MLSGCHAANGPITQADIAIMKAGAFRSVKLMDADHSPDVAAVIRAALPGVQIVVRLSDYPAPGGSNFSATVAAQWYAAIVKWFRVGVKVFQLGNEPNEASSPYSRPEWGPWKFQFYYRLTLLALRDKLKAAGYTGLGLISAPLSYSPEIHKTAWRAAYANTGGGTMPSILSLCDYVGANCYWQADGDMYNPDFGRNFDEMHTISGGKSVVICEYGDSSGRREIEAARIIDYPAYLKWAGTFGYVQSAHVFIVGGSSDWAGFRLTTAEAQAIARGSK